MQDPSCVHDLETYIGLLRCPKRLIQTQRDIGTEVFLNKAKELILTAQKFDTWPWQNAVRNVGDLVQTLMI
ncbi:hypothetical protein FRX31_030358 [Thalictrum thalictroides]|uniref:Uncharacterized protein n=1 Tax=Thalictrum thalictroides TaxID=46969 RepID=A0A7J6V786_THATH|nr:hypothetical protein FRX31_030358 [Thalictrum thalictroides]